MRRLVDVKFCAWIVSWAFLLAGNRSKNMWQPCVKRPSAGWLRLTLKVNSVGGYVGWSNTWSPSPL